MRRVAESPEETIWECPFVKIREFGLVICAWHECALHGGWGGQFVGAVCGIGLGNSFQGDSSRGGFFEIFMTYQLTDGNGLLRRADVHVRRSVNALVEGTRCVHRRVAIEQRGLKSLGA